MQKIKKYLWYVPALYVAFMFGEKITEGLAHSEEFIQIISLVSPLKKLAYTLTPLVGLLDFSVAVALLLNPVFTKNNKIQTFLFIWVICWPFLPASLRYFSGIGDFEIVEVLSISMSALVAYFLWRRFSLGEKLI